jgi:hypothetical protein
MMMSQLRDHDQECEHGNIFSHSGIKGEKFGFYCPGGAEVKGPQFVAALPGNLQIVGAHGMGHSSGIAVAKDQRYQIIEVDPIDRDTGLIEGINPFRTLVTLEMAKVIDDAVKVEVTHQMQEWAPDERVIKERVTAEVKRQLRPAIIAAMTHTRWQLNTEDSF